MTAPQPADDPVRACTGCQRTTVKVIGRGLCARCYDAHRRAGTLPPKLHRTGLDRVMVWIEDIRSRDGCWPWPGAKTQGYGSVRIDGRDVMIHRLVYELLVGPIPAGLHLDHQCHNITEHCSDDARCPHRACANPAHVEPVTSAVNTLRGHTLPAENLRKTACPEGHPYGGDNLYVHPKTGSRKCRECRRASDRRAYWREKAQAS